MVTDKGDFIKLEEQCTFRLSHEIDIRGALPSEGDC